MSKNKNNQAIWGKRIGKKTSVLFEKVGSFREDLRAGEDLVWMNSLRSYQGKLDVNNEGRLIRYNDFYKKEGVNVNFIEKISDDQFKIRTYERGVENETLACGTGSTASAICMNFLGRTKSGKITMKCRGGDLNVQFNSSNNGFEEISITGPAKLVFDGTIKVKV